MGEYRNIRNTKGGFVAGCLLLLSAAFSMTSVFTTWWTGGRPARVWAHWEHRATLWRTAAKVDFMTPEGRSMVDASPELSALDSMLTIDSRWELLCEMPQAQRDNGFQDICFRILVARCFTVLSTICSVPSAAILFFGSIIGGSAQILFIGGVFALFSSLCTTVGLICGVLIGTEGLHGLGYICLGIAWGAGTAGTALSTFFLRHELHMEDRIAAGYGDNEYGSSSSGDGRISHSREASLREAALTDAEQAARKMEFDVINLEDLWQTLDEKGDGKVPFGIFSKALLDVCSLPSESVIRTLMNEVDSDQSGTIEKNEFLAFFAFVNDLNKFGKQRQLRGRLCRYLLAMYLVVALIALMALLAMEVNMSHEERDSDNGKAISMGRLGAMILVIHGVLSALLWPLVCLKCRRQIEHYSSGDAFIKMGQSVRAFANRKNKFDGIPERPPDLAWEPPPEPLPKKSQEQYSYVAAAQHRRQIQAQATRQAAPRPASAGQLCRANEHYQDVEKVSSTPSSSSRPHSAPAATHRHRAECRIEPLPPQPLGAPQPPIEPAPNAVYRGGSKESMPSNTGISSDSAKFNRRESKASMASQTSARRIGKASRFYDASNYKQAKLDQCHQAYGASQFNPWMTKNQVNPYAAFNPYVKEVSPVKEQAPAPIAHRTSGQSVETDCKSDPSQGLEVTRKSTVSRDEQLSPKQTLGELPKDWAHNSTVSRGDGATLDPRMTKNQFNPDAEFNPHKNKDIQADGMLPLSWAASVPSSQGG